MKLFRKKEKRSENTGTGEAAGGILTAFFGKNAVITKEQALEIPTVASCVSLIAERIAALPVKLYRQDGKKVTEILEDKRLDMLNHDTGDTINASEMKKLWVRDYFLSKGSYTYIERNMYNEPTAIYYVDESRVAIVPNSDPIHKTYAVQVSGRTFFSYEFIKILRFSKGYGTGRSIIDENPLALAIFYNTMKFENATIRKGGNKRGFLKAQSTVDKNAMDKLREAWQALYSNSNDSADNIVILNNGIDFKEASSTSVELQLNENKQTNAAEICKLFCMPVELLNGKATETQVSQFVQNCLMPAINTIEAALDHDLLTEAEKNGHYYFGIDTDELTRGDFATRMNAYAVAYEHNFYQLDEIREKEDLPPLDFNFIKLGLDAVLVDPKTREIYTPNTGKLEKMNAEHLTDEQLRAILEERYNPYHDPVTGQFTTGNMAGWSSGAALVVEKGEKGAGKYVFNSEHASSEPSANKIHFVPASSIDEARKYTEEILGIDTTNKNLSLALESGISVDKADFSSINLESANMINREITEAYNTFGNLNQSGDLKSIRIIWGKISSSNAVAAYSPNNKEIVLRKGNLSNKSSISSLKTKAMREYNDGWWSTGEAEHSVRHEIGHAVQYMILDNKIGNAFGNSTKKIHDISTLRNDLMRDLGISTWKRNDTPENKKRAGTKLSYYGLKDNGEFIAESIAEYMTGHPRDTAKKVVDILLRKD